MYNPHNPKDEHIFCRANLKSSLEYIEINSSLIFGRQSVIVEKSIENMKWILKDCDSENVLCNIPFNLYLDPRSISQNVDMVNCVLAASSIERLDNFEIVSVSNKFSISHDYEDYISIWNEFSYLWKNSDDYNDYSSSKNTDHTNSEHLDLVKDLYLQIKKTTGSSFDSVKSIIESSEFSELLTKLNYGKDNKGKTQNHNVKTKKTKRKIS